MNQVAPAAISVSTVFGKRVFFPEITLQCIGDDLYVYATVDKKTERQNGWTPSVIMEMIQRVSAEGIVWSWEVEQDPSLREWTVLGTMQLMRSDNGVHIP